MIRSLPAPQAALAGHCRRMRLTYVRSIDRQKVVVARCVQPLQPEAVALGIEHIDDFMQRHAVQRWQPECEDPTIPPPAACKIKCLVFLANGSPLLVVLDLNHRVSEALLARHLRISKSRLKLAPPGELVSICGFPVGAVPPFSHQPQALRTIVDEHLTRHSHVVFGPSAEYVLPCAELLRACAGSLAAVSRSGGDAATPSGGAQLAVKQNPLPWKDGAQAATISGIIAVKRKIAKLLVFASVVPLPAGPAPQPDSGALVRRLWRHPVLDTPCEVQLILGKTLEGRLGREGAERLFKSLRVGQCIQVTGRPQPRTQNAASGDAAGGDGDEARENIHSVDIVVHDIVVLDAAATAAAFARAAAEQRTAGALGDSSAGAVAVKASSAPAGPFYQPRVPAERVVLVDDVDDIHFASELLFSAQQGSSDVVTAAALEADLSDRQVGADSGTSPAPVGFLPPGSPPPPYGISWKPRVVVGLDAEWQPYARGASKTLVSILQLATPTHVLVIDMLTICGPQQQPGSSTGEEGAAAGSNSTGAGGLTAAQQALSDLLERLMGDVNVATVGFHVTHDLKRLAESYPWMPCFGGVLFQSSTQKDCSSSNISVSASCTTPSSTEKREERDALPGAFRTVPVRSHVEIAVLAQAAGGVGEGDSALRRLGLAGLCEAVLGLPLDKGQQCSDWAERPLSAAQLAYAAADACCLVDMFEALSARREGLLSPALMAAYQGRVTDVSLFRPSPYGDFSPPEEEVTGIWPALSSTTAGFNTGMPRRARVTSRGGERVDTLACNVALLMQFLGKPLPGSGKVAAVQVAACSAAASPDDPALAAVTSGYVGGPVPRFPRGSGVLEFTNAFMLFVNLPSPKYPNNFTIAQGQGDDDTSACEPTNAIAGWGGPCCEMSWWGGRGQTSSHPVMQRLLGLRPPGEESAAGGTSSNAWEPPTVLLMCRPFREPYVCFGRVVPANVVDDGVHLRVSWQLLDYPTLRHSPHFQHLLQLQHELPGSVGSSRD